jgi:hypothetical protein
VHTDAEQQTEAGDPQQLAVTEHRVADLAQELRVGVELLRPLVDLEVADHVHEDEQEQDRARHRHEDLLAYGGSVKAERFAHRSP